MIFTLHMMGAILNAGPHAEFSVESQGAAAGFYGPRLEAQDGAVQIPAGPGWGVGIDTTWLAQAERLVSEN